MSPVWLAVASVLVGASTARADDAGSPPPPPADAPPADSAPITPPSATPARPSPDGGADYFPPPRAKDIVIESQDDRSTNNLVLVGSLAAGTAVIGGLGAYFNFDARSASDSISAHRPTNSIWTPHDQALFDQAHTSSVRAGVCYGIGGALLIGTIVTLIVTEPKSHTTIIHPHGTGTARASAMPTLAPAPGGAVLGGAWSF